MSLRQLFHIAVVKRSSYKSWFNRISYVCVTHIKAKIYSANNILHIMRGVTQLIVPSHVVILSVTKLCVKDRVRSKSIVHDRKRFFPGII